uniref:Uncharacterized protein n=1 Tax=Daphnia galeata TaxID=27404 RepID=A0A8J2RFS0_9CRUS|nr:unnamed protein product [Daphnia galeata]
MFFCPGSIGLLNDDDGSDWGDIDNFYNHPSSYHTFQHHTGDHDNKFSKMGSLMGGFHYQQLKSCCSASVTNCNFFSNEEEEENTVEC